MESINLERRTGIFTEISPDKCNHYGRFLQGLQRYQADAIFWSMFIIMIGLLMIASTLYTKTSQVNPDPEQGAIDPKIKTKRVQTYLICSVICFVVGIVVVVLEAFAGLDIQFCDGEDLMMFYWAFWTLISIGSLIAILGIITHQSHELMGMPHPPWNVALGTPVVVLAALGFILRDCCKRSVKAEPFTTGDAQGTHVGFGLDGSHLYSFPTRAMASQNTLVRDSIPLGVIPTDSMAAVAISSEYSTAKEEASPQANTSTPALTFALPSRSA